MKVISILLLSVLLVAGSALAEDRDVSVFYYPWYDTNRHWQEGYLRDELVPVQSPLLGEYDNRSAVTIDQHLDWSEDSGIDHWICAWWGPGSWEDMTVRDFIAPRMTGRNVTYCLLYESAGLLGLQNDAITFDPEKTDILRSHFQYFAANHFGDPGYQRIDGRPVVYLYLTRTFGGTYEQAFQLVRQDMLALGFDVYLIGDEVYWGTPDSTRIATLDAITAYNMHGPAHLAGYPGDRGFLTQVSVKYSQYQSTASGLNVAFIPNIMPGFNDRGVRLEANHLVISPQVSSGASHTSTLEGFIDVAENHLDPVLDAVAVTSFNEWHEDTQIEPTVIATATTQDQSGVGDFTQEFSYVGYGTDLLEVIRERMGPIAVAVPPTVFSNAIRLEGYPNPFNSRVVVQYEVGEAEQVTLRVYSATGRLVRTLLERAGPGSSQGEVAWLGDDLAGRPVASGVYFVRLETGAEAATRRLSLVK